MQDYQKLTVWQRAVELAVDVYSVIRTFPSDEKYALSSQMKRAVTSIAINIAEGCGRDSKKELINFVHIAQGSTSELECELIIAQRLGFLNNSTAEEILDKVLEVKRMLWSFERKINPRLKTEG